MSQVFFAKKGIVPTYPENGTLCKEGAEDENTTIFHMLCLLGFVKGDKPHPQVCGCFFIQNPQDIKANEEAVRTALGRPNLRVNLVEKLKVLENLSAKYTESKDTRCFVNMAKSSQCDRMVCEHLTYPVYDQEEIFCVKRETFPEMPKPASEYKAVHTAGVVQMVTDNYTTRSWGVPGVAAAIVAHSVAKAKRVHVKPEDIRAETVKAKLAFEEIKALADQRENDVNIALEVKSAKEERKAILAALKEQEERLRALDAALASATA
jgi:hypothetical protein